MKKTAEGPLCDGSVEHAVRFCHPLSALRSDVERALREADELELVTRGRRTGRPHAVRLWFTYADGALWLRTDRDAERRGPDWYRNLLRDPRCVVRIDGHELDGEMEPIEDREEALRHLVELLRAKYGAIWVGDWWVERGRLPVRIRLRRD